MWYNDTYTINFFFSNFQKKSNPKFLFIKIIIKEIV